MSDGLDFVFVYTWPILAVIIGGVLVAGLSSLSLTVSAAVKAAIFKDRSSSAVSIVGAGLFSLTMTALGSIGVIWLLSCFGGYK